MPTAIDLCIADTSFERQPSRTLRLRRHYKFRKQAPSITLTVLDLNRLRRFLGLRCFALANTVDTPENDKV